MLLASFKRVSHIPLVLVKVSELFFSSSRHCALTAMSDILPPLDSGRYIAENSKDVKIRPEGVTKVANLMYEKIKSGSYSIKSWKEHELNPKQMDKDAVDWIFFADTLNFSFWSKDESKKFAVRFNDKLHTGYWSLCAAMNRALAEGVTVTDPNFYGNMDMEQMKQIFQSDTDYDMPLVEQRLDVIHEAGKTLLAKYDGSFANCIEKCDKSAQTLLKLIVSEFPSYKDEAEFCGKKVAIYKRAQILVADIWACFEGQGYGEFNDIDSITMFADYRIPQSLLYFGALEYSDKLVEYLRKDHLMNSGDRYEVEIRGCSIWSTELIQQETRRLLDAQPETKGMMANSILIDHYLWDYRREHASDAGMLDIPLHKIRCIYY